MRHFVRQDGGVIVNNTSIYGSTDSPASGRTSPPNMRSKA